MNEQHLYARFRTPEHYYVYDTYSNQILTTSERAWQLIDDVIQHGGDGADGSDAADSDTQRAVEEIHAARSDGFLGPVDIARMTFYADRDRLAERVHGHVSQLVLELTTRCNLRCRYCANTYRPRIERPRQMDWATAVNAMTVFRDYSAEARDRTISFWGGEPLMCFGLLRRVVDHVAEAFPDLAPGYAFTTNATLMTAEIASFLAAHRMKLLVSLDGPAEVHDRYRRDADGGPTFERVMAGLRCLADTNEEYYRTDVAFNCVLAPGNDLRVITEFFGSNELVRTNRVQFNRVSNDGTPFFQDYGPYTREQEEFLTAEVFGITDAASRMRSASQVVLKGLEKIAMRTRTPVGDFVFPNGCCVPLLKKMLVTTQGDIELCEQHPYANFVGNVNRTGVNYQAIADLVREYTARSIADCRACWAVRLCSACYKHFMEHGAWKDEGRAQACERRRATILRSLRTYALVMERKPDAFGYLQDMEFVFPV